MPRRPSLRILLLLIVAGVAIGIAGALFSGGETGARDPAVTAGAPPPTEAPPERAPSSATVTTTAPIEAAAAAGTTTLEPPAPEAASLEPTAPESTPAAPPSPPAEPAEPEAEPAEPEAEPAEPPAPSAPDAEPAEPAEPDTSDDQPPASGAAGELIELLRPLVATPDPNVPDYDRDHFAGWLDDDGDCVNTRHEVLQSEAVDFSMNAEGCAVASGEWFDPYTDRTYTNPRDLDVDHVVALADAWVSGAWAWADELLDRFSNDLGNLNAIAAGENRSKSARGPANYSPSAPGARCEYLVQYATVKIRWQLSITPQDFEVVATGLSSCEVGIVPDASPAALDPSEPTATPTTSPQPESDCHPAYEPCLPNLPGDALNCGDLRSDQKPVTVIQPGTDPYRLDRDGDGRGCTS